jgi:predicted ATP-dependent serine protease
LNEIPIASEIAFCGELGLTGEIRPSSQLAERSRLLNRLGKKLLVAAPTTDRRPLDLRVKSVCHLRDALGALKADLERQKNEGNSRPSFQ